MTTASRARPAAGRVLLSALMLVLCVVFVALSVWQLERRAWKLDLIARVEARAHGAPAPLPPADAPAADIEYLRVAATGRFMPGATLTKAVTDLGGGSWVMTPFRTDAGAQLLVNRGFVPDGTRPADVAPPPSSPVTLTGLVRSSEPGGGFLRSNDPAANRWYSRDVAAIAQTAKLADPLPYFVDADAGLEDPAATGVRPVGGLTVIRFPNNHLVYALTWIALALLSAGAVVPIWRSRRAPDDRAEGNGP